MCPKVYVTLNLTLTAPESAASSTAVVAVDTVSETSDVSLRETVAALREPLNESIVMSCIAKPVMSLIVLGIEFRLS